MKIKFEDFSEAEEMLIEIVNFMRYEADRELRKDGDFIALREAIVVAFDEWWTAKHKMTKKVEWYGKGGTTVTQVISSGEPHD